MDAAGANSTPRNANRHSLRRFPSLPVADERARQSPTIRTSLPVNTRRLPSFTPTLPPLREDPRPLLSEEDLDLDIQPALERTQSLPLFIFFPTTFILTISITDPNNTTHTPFTPPPSLSFSETSSSSSSSFTVPSSVAAWEGEWGEEAYAYDYDCISRKTWADGGWEKLVLGDDQKSEDNETRERGG